MQGFADNRLFGRADFLKRLFDAIPSLLFIVDEDVRIFHLNSASMKILGSKLDSVLMKRGGEVLHCVHSLETPEGCGRAPSCSDCVVRNSVTKAVSGEKVYRETAKMGLLNEGRISDIYVAVTASPLEYEGRSFVLLIIEDISELKKAEAALSSRTEQLEEANKELEAFSYAVAHDLRAPLRAISGFGKALLEDFSGKLDGKGIDYLERITSAARRMSQLIDDLLKLSRLHYSGVNYQIVDLSAIAAEIASGLRNSDPGRNAEFLLAGGISTYGDASLLRAALENLFANAWKFTSRTPRAIIEFGVDGQDGDPVYFVRDNGAGFDMAYAEKLFKPFQRLHSHEEFPGTGIGLATVHRIIRRHSGKIWAEGDMGKGAVVYFTLGKTK